MSDLFNPYYEWLGLADLNAPNYYQLLSLEPFEADETRINVAADRAMSRVRGFKPGGRSREWAELLDELSAAKKCLLSADAKDTYDQQLRASGVTSPLEPSESYGEAIELAEVNRNQSLYPPGMEPVVADEVPETDVVPTTRVAEEPASDDTAPATVPHRKYSKTDLLPPTGPAAATPSSPAPGSAADAATAPTAPAGPAPIAHPVATPISRLPMASIPGAVPTAGPTGAQPIPATPAPNPMAAIPQAAALDPMAPIHHATVDPMAPLAHPTTPVSSGSADPMAPVGFPASAAAGTANPNQAPSTHPLGGPVNSSIPLANPISAGSAPYAGAPTGLTSGVLSAEPVVANKGVEDDGERQARLTAQIPILISITVVVIALVSLVTALAFQRMRRMAVQNKPVVERPSEPEREPARPANEPGGPGTTTRPGDAPPANARPGDAGPAPVAPNVPKTNVPINNVPTNNVPTNNVPNNNVPVKPPADDNPFAVPPSNGDPGTEKGNPPPTDPPETPKTGNVEQMTAALIAAKLAIGEQDFERFDQEIALAQSAAGTEDHKMMVERLNKVGQYVKRFWSAVNGAIQRFQGAEEMMVGNTVIIVVDTGPDWITIRFSGINKRYSVQELPPAVAVAIAEQLLDTTQPETRAIKAAFVITMPDVDKGNLEKARRWLDEAELGGFDTDDIRQVIDDRYGE